MPYLATSFADLSTNLSPVATYDILKVASALFIFSCSVVQTPAITRGALHIGSSCISGALHTGCSCISGALHIGNSCISGAPAYREILHIGSSAFRCVVVSGNFFSFFLVIAEHDYTATFVPTVNPSRSL